MPAAVAGARPDPQVQQVTPGPRVVPAMPATLATPVTLAQQVTPGQPATRVTLVTPAIPAIPAIPAQQVTPAPPLGRGCLRSRLRRLLSARPRTNALMSQMQSLREDRQW